jgi:hypothetical protein
VLIQVQTKHLSALWTAFGSRLADVHTQQRWHLTPKVLQVHISLLIMTARRVWEIGKINAFQFHDQLQSILCCHNKIAARPKRVSELEAVMLTVHYHWNVQAGNMLVIDWLLVGNIHVFKVAEFFLEFFWVSWLN